MKIFVYVERGHVLSGDLNCKLELQRQRPGSFSIFKILWGSWRFNDFKFIFRLNNLKALTWKKHKTVPSFRISQISQIPKRIFQNATPTHPRQKWNPYPCPASSAESAYEVVSHRANGVANSCFRLYSFKALNVVPWTQVFPTFLCSVVWFIFFSFRFPLLNASRLKILVFGITYDCSFCRVVLKRLLI